MQWHPIDTAPTGRPIWVALRWKRTRYERIATHQAGERADPRQWDFDSKQVRMNALNALGPLAPFGEHHTIRVTAWRELDHENQEDPNNLGRPRRTPEREEERTKAREPEQAEIPF